MEQILSKSYTLRSDNGAWLGQVVLTSDGLFAAVTEYGNFSFAWRNFGGDDFRKFMCNLSVDYFGAKVYTGMTYIISGSKCEKACQRFAEMILPPLQKILRRELMRGLGSNMV